MSIVRHRLFGVVGRTIYETLGLDGPRGRASPRRPAAQACSADNFLREQNVTMRDRRFVSRSVGRPLLFLFVLSIAAAARAQNGTSSESAAQAVQAPPPAYPPAGQLTFGERDGELSGRWIPLGPAPVDQAGAGRRGYVLAGEDGLVTRTGSNQVSIHTVAANNFYREENREFLITQRYETHTIGIDFRRGFKVGGGPRFELGGQVQLHESDSGILNGFILGLEKLWVSMTGFEQSQNQLRSQGAAAPPRKLARIVPQWQR